MKTVALLLILLASPVFAQETSDTNNPLWACGPAATKFDVTVTPPADVVPVQVPSAGKALVYVIEDLGQVDNMISSGSPFRIGLDGAWIGALKGRSFFRSPSLRESIISVRTGNRDGTNTRRSARLRISRRNPVRPTTSDYDSRRRTECRRSISRKPIVMKPAI